LARAVVAVKPLSLVSQDTAAMLSIPRSKKSDESTRRNGVGAAATSDSNWYNANTNADEKIDWNVLELALVDSVSYAARSVALTHVGDVVTRTAVRAASESLISACWDGFNMAIVASLVLLSEYVLKMDLQGESVCAFPISLPHFVGGGCFAIPMKKKIPSLLSTFIPSFHLLLPFCSD